MKKIITLVCTIACIFGLTACGSEPEYTDLEKAKLEGAKSAAVETILPCFQLFMDDENMKLLDGYTAEEISYMMQSSFGFYADGNAIIGAATSFNNATEAIGEIVKVGEIVELGKEVEGETVEVEIDDKTIIVTIPVEGTIKSGNAEIILSNDMFYELQSAALNEKSTLGDAMVKAALNTIIGMGTVFIVLVLISFIIALFGFIPKIQAKIEEGKKKKEVKEESIDNTIAQIAAKEEVDVTDDYELVAVIAAAIAASEGAASTDGFVVRSVRKVNRRR